jgi:multidrug efflux pump subunit AcrA (membrane-fusion protein)
VDERNISYIKPGMTVELDQWGTFGMGVVESVSLSSTISNGVATYPIVITADNFDESIQVNSYINYRITASQNDNCLVLPIQSVRTVGLEDGSMETVVYVKSDFRPETAIDVPYSDEEIPEGFWPVPVEIGIQDHYNVEIKSGVEEGTEVFTQILSNNVWG